MSTARLFILMLLSLLIVGCGGNTSAMVLPTESPFPSAADTTPSPSRTLEQTWITSTPSPTTTPVEPQATEESTTTVIDPTTVALQKSATPTRPPTRTPTRTPRPTLEADEWKKLPVVPTISDKAIEIYRRGLELGNNPHAFSKIGDCGSTPAWFLGDFDRGPQFYSLGEYEELQPVIEQFAGSFDRTSLAARSGFNASSLFVSLWSDRKYCNANEAPLLCEYRVHRPIIAFIMLGANDVWRPQEFEPQMRKIIQLSLNNGIIPILSTKADNQEKDGSINAMIARLAYEYDVPLWNYWLAVQDLPDGGLQEDGVHLTFGRNFFDDPQAMSNAWPIRNLTALQVLNAVWQKISGQSP